MRPRLKLAFANALLLFVSIAVTYLVASFVIFRFLLPHLSLNLHPHFPDIAELFAQTSKAGAVPRDYITLLGDSYAEGQGDGLLAANGDRAEFVQSAHVLQRLTGRDVVSLGLGGAGSVQAMVRSRAHLNGNCFLYPRLDPPRRMSFSLRGRRSRRERLHRRPRRGRGCGHARDDRALCERELRSRPSLRCFTISRDDVQDGALPHRQHGELRERCASPRPTTRCWRAERRTRRLRCRNRPPNVIRAHLRHHSRCSTCRSSG